MKKILYRTGIVFLCCLLSVLGAIPASAAESRDDPDSVIITVEGDEYKLTKGESIVIGGVTYNYSEEEVPTKAIRHSYSKTVVNQYSNFEDIPTSIYYSEYNDELGAWFSGRLSLTSTQLSGGIWYATFVGLIYGYI
jgi:hypothetical protein